MIYLCFRLSESSTFQLQSSKSQLLVNKTIPTGNWKYGVGIYCQLNFGQFWPQILSGEIFLYLILLVLFLPFPGLEDHRNRCPFFDDQINMEGKETTNQGQTDDRYDCTDYGHNLKLFGLISLGHRVYNESKITS